MKHQISCHWKEALAFEAEVNGHQVKMDANPEAGGKDFGPRPKQLMLSALAGCTGMDVASLLKKMRIEVDGFDISVSGELSEEHPKYYTQIHLIYQFKGKDLNKEKIYRAVELSQEKYCGISKMLKSASELTFEIKYLD
ncbi:MAG: OsmC family protein [Candidatus Cyclobacteriaceae bacterium M3_2C_046]